MSRVRAVLFDVDGTLLDSNDAHAHAWLDVLRGHGVNVAFDVVRAKIGLDGGRLLREVSGIDPGSTHGQAILDMRVALFKAHYLPDLGPFPGARALVDRLRSRGLACVVVSSAKSLEIADLLRAAAVADLVDIVVTADAAEHGKPDPDLVRIALERAAVAADEAVFIGDTPYDVAAGERAGVATIALRCGGSSDEDLDGAIAVYDTPADLAAKLAGSPFEVDLARETISSRRAARSSAARL